MTVIVDLPNIEPFTFAVHESDDLYISSNIRDKGRWEPFETEIFSRLLTADVEFFDIGANIGWYSVLGGRCLQRRGTVHAFEPVPENVALLARNVAANALTNVRVNPFALGRSTGTARMYLSPDNKGDHRAYSSDEERPSILTGLRRFDEYFDRGTNKPLVVKMDTQGFEYDILLGMGDILTSHKAEISMIVEFWPYGLHQNGVAVESLIGLLAGHGFAPWVLAEEDPQIRPSSWSSLGAAAQDMLAPATKRYVNLLLSREPKGLIHLLDGLFGASASPLVPS
jgi:FkbM family methyltransferase